MSERTFWTDDFLGEAEGGHSISSDLPLRIKEFESKGHTVVGLKILNETDCELICLKRTDKTHAS